MQKRRKSWNLVSVTQRHLQSPIIWFSLVVNWRRHLKKKNDETQKSKWRRTNEGKKTQNASSVVGETINMNTLHVRHKWMCARAALTCGRQYFYSSPSLESTRKYLMFVCEKWFSFSRAFFLVWRKGSKRKSSDKNERKTDKWNLMFIFPTFFRERW